jgi:hypothetical protein
MDSKAAQSELQKFTSSRKSAGDYYTESQDALGVGGARENQESLKGLIRNTEKQLAGVGESVAGRTRGNLVTEAQRARLQNLESQPIAQNLGTQQTQYADASQQLQNLMGQAGQQAGMAYQTDADRQAALEANYNRLYGSERDAAQEAFARQQWEAQTQQADRQFEEMKRQFEAQQANIRNQYAQQASLFTNAQTSQKEAEAKQKAMEAETIRQYNNQVNEIAQQENNRVKSSLPTFTTGNFLNDLTSSIKKYGPGAIFGKGFLW